MKFIQISIAAGTDEDLSDRIYALGEDGMIYCLSMDHDHEWGWRVMPDIDAKKLYRARLG